MGIFSKDEDSTYIIVEAITSTSLMKKVSKKLEEGYAPYSQRYHEPDLENLEDYQQYLAEKKKKY